MWRANNNSINPQDLEREVGFGALFLFKPFPRVQLRLWQQSARQAAQGILHTESCPLGSSKREQKGLKKEPQAEKSLVNHPGSSTQHSVTTFRIGGMWEGRWAGWGHRYACDWFMLICGRNLYNIVKQLFNNKKKKLCPQCTFFLLPLKKESLLFSWSEACGSILI